MRMGCNSRVKRSLVYCFCVSLGLMTYQRPAHAVIPGLLGLAKLYDQAIASRYFQSLNGETPTYSRMLEILENTESSLNGSLSRELVSFNPSGWYINNSFSWASVALSANPDLLSLDDFHDKTEDTEISFISDAVPNGDGTYQIHIDGVEQTVVYKPNIKNPVVVSRPISSSSNPISPAPTNGVVSLPKISDSYEYYRYDYNTDLYDHSNSSYEVALKAVSNTFENNSYYDEKYSSIDGNDYLVQKCTIDYIPVSSSESLSKIIHKIEAKIECESLKSNFNFYPFDAETNQYVLTLPSSSDYTKQNDSIEKSMTVSINSKFNSSKSSVKIGTIEDMLTPLSVLKEKKLPVSFLRNLLNELMLKASSSSNYDGVPFDSKSLFTDSDIEIAIEGLNYHPSYYDLFSPAASSDGLLNFDIKTISIEIYNIIYGGNNQNDIKDNDFGDFEPPEIESPPENVLDGFGDFFPFLSDFTIEERNVDCPVVEFDAFGSTYIIDSHCPLLEQNRSLFELIMMIVWAFVSLRIVLKA